MVEVGIRAVVADLAFDFVWVSPYDYRTIDYDRDATEALQELERGYNRIRAAINAGMKPTAKAG